MKIIDVLEQLEDSQLFKDWKKDNPDDYLVNFFKFIQTEETPWQIGFFNKKTDLITTFNIDHEITKNDASEVFKKEDETIDVLKLEVIQIDYEEALKSAVTYQQENHPVDKPTKIIVLLQNKGAVMYNITLITQTLKTINIKVSPLDGSVMETKITNLMDFKRED